MLPADILTMAFSVGVHAESNESQQPDQFEALLIVGLMCLRAGNPEECDCPVQCQPAAHHA